MKDNEKKPVENPYIELADHWLQQKIDERVLELIQENEKLKTDLRQAHALWGEGFLEKSRREENEKKAEAEADLRQAHAFVKKKEGSWFLHYDYDSKPLWGGWALREGFLAGVEYQKCK